MQSELTITRDDLAALTGWSKTYITRNWLKLHQNEGFPRKLPDTWRWPRALVEAWISTGGAAQAFTMPDGEEKTYLKSQRDTLRKRYAGATR